MGVPSPCPRISIKDTITISGLLNKQFLCTDWTSYKNVHAEMEVEKWQVS